MRLYAALGQTQAARRQYAELERLLQEELDAEPSAATRALLRDLDRLATLRPLTADRSPLATRSLARRQTPEPAPTHAARGYPDRQPPGVERAGGENRQVTLLFTDMCRTVETTQELHPEDAALLVNRLLHAMVDVLLKYEGRVDHYLGDGLLAVFGGHMAHEDDPERAIRAALEMREASRRLGLEVRIGINTGLAYVGEIGGEHHREITVMGPAVNLAARLQEGAEPGEILVGAATYRQTRRAFAFSPHSLTVKGIVRPVATYRVEHAMPRPEKTRGIEGRRAPLIGREKELAGLREALEAMLAGQGQMVSVIGEAGVGKSRLVSELKGVVG